MKNNNHTDINQSKELEKIFGDHRADGIFCYELVDGVDSLSWNYIHHWFGEEFFGADYIENKDPNDIPSWSLESLLELIYEKKPELKISFNKKLDENLWVSSDGKSDYCGEYLIDSIYNLIINNL